MTTVNKIIRKIEKKEKRKAAKRDHKQIVAEHNLVFDHSKVVEANQKPRFVAMEAESWNSPFKGDVNIEAPTLSQMFHLPSAPTKHEETVVVPEGV